MLPPVIVIVSLFVNVDEEIEPVDKLIFSLFVIVVEFTAPPETASVPLFLIDFVFSAPPVPTVNDALAAIVSTRFSSVLLEMTG